MTTVEQTIKDKLNSQLDINILEVINESPQHNVPEGSESHFRVLIISNDFKGLSTIQRHQKVYKILEKELQNLIHAFSQKTLTLPEWEQIGGLVSYNSPPCVKK